MADGFIVRRGGKATEQALAPTITEVSVTDLSITFTIKNEDTDKAIIRYRIDDIDDEGEIIELAGGATSSNITESGLDDDTEFIVFATANVTGKVKSNVTQLAITTDKGIVFTAATGGTTEEYDDGGKRYKSHTFTSNGTFEVTTVGDATDDRNKVDYLIVAGGGSGGGRLGGGGGAGGYRTTNGTSGGNSSAESKITVTAQSYGITVGAGGSNVSEGTRGNNGTNSSAFGITSTGGGGGGARGSNTLGQGKDGGSGGGGGGTNDAMTGPGGSGTSNQGKNGADKVKDTGAGGGGAGQQPQDPIEFDGGDGGNGLANTLRTGSNETRAGGGGGGSVDERGVGGTGGGGNGGEEDNNAESGQENTGGGGGGGNNIPNERISGNGGSGIVIVRYEIAPSV
jgi:hypothetical protein